MAAREPNSPRVPENILRAFAKLCVKNSEYDFVRGGHGKSFVDVDALSGIDAFSDEGRDAQRLIETLIQKIKLIHASEDLKAVVFVERDSGPVGLLSGRIYIAEQVGLPCLIVRPKKRITRFALKGGRLSQGDKVVLVNDVSTTGQTIGEAAETLWALGARIVAAIPLVDRDEGAKSFLERLDIVLDPVVARAELEAALSD